ncbi:hypothetical protein [Gaiella sp.]|uniref:hypothetical protein n=1 Tax=Gaiella sp. TaxID=2663207 RepID=UPI002E2EA673|nr:hypothetical protein [Gaiella sp.]HEX5582407.1 hypothetical protein [Gaiella sp.]
MTAPQPATFEQFVGRLQRVAARAPLAETEDHERIRRVAAELVELQDVDAASLAALLSKPNGKPSPHVREALGLVVGLGRERLTSELRAGLPDGGDRQDPEKIIAFLDVEFGLLAEIKVARARQYEWADVLVARSGSRGTAGAAIVGGRSVEDRIEEVIRALRLPYQVRTRFVGRGGDTAPADMAIPDGFEGAQIVCAAKGFDSTGSKLGDAVTEIVHMANVRLPTQFVLAVVDGIGWHRRRADLERIYRLFENRQIDGLYSLAMLDEFRDDVDHAASLRGIARVVY